MKQKLLVLLNLFLMVLKDPRLNLILNTLMMVMALTMAVSQWAIGNVPVALTLTISGVSNISAILFWLLIWLTGAKHTPRSSNG